MAWNEYNPQEYELDRSGHMAERRLSLIESYLKRTNGNVLDFGCGVGKDLSLLAKKYPFRRFIGIDTDKRFIEYANSKMKNSSNVSFTNSFDDLSNIKSKFGFIYSIDVLHHVDGISSVANQMHKILKKNGLWLSIEPNILNPKVFLNQFLKKDERLFFKKKTEKIFLHSGFKIVEKGLFLLIPYQIKKPHKSLIFIEKKLETFFGGSVFYLLQKI